MCIVSFIFTRCQLSCPRISSIMKSLQEKLAGSSVLLVSLSVDPEHDTPEVLADYAGRYGAFPDRWWFRTGPRTVIYNLIGHKFKLSVMPNPSPAPEGEGEAIAHSDRLALLDRGRVVGLFVATPGHSTTSSPGPGEVRSLGGPRPCPRSTPASTPFAHAFSFWAGASFAGSRATMKPGSHCRRREGNPRLLAR